MFRATTSVPSLMTLWTETDVQGNVLPKSQWQVSFIHSQNLITLCISGHQTEWALERLSVLWRLSVPLEGEAEVLQWPSSQNLYPPRCLTSFLLLIPQWGLLSLGNSEFSSQSIAWQTVYSCCYNHNKHTLNPTDLWGNHMLILRKNVPDP